MKKVKIISLAVLALSLHSCKKDYLFREPVVIPPANLSFSTDIFPLLTTYNCKNCHSGAEPPKITMDTAATYAVLAGPGTPWINLTSPTLSDFYISVTSAYGPGQMPKGQNSLSDNEQARILAWIQQGGKP